MHQQKKQRDSVYMYVCLPPLSECGRRRTRRETRRRMERRERKKTRLVGNESSCWCVPPWASVQLPSFCSPASLHQDRIRDEKQMEITERIRSALGLGMKVLDDAFDTLEYQHQGGGLCGRGSGITGLVGWSHD